MSGSLALRVLPMPVRLGRGRMLIERNFLVYRRAWLVFVSGFFEPVFYLLSIGVGVAALVGDFTLSDGTTVSYTAFVAPAMLASSAMNGAIFDSTYNIFFRMKYIKLYDAMLATPLRPRDIAAGEIGWALLRGAAYSAAFLAVMLAMGLVDSWWALLALPYSVLIGFAFAGAGMALTTFMRTWQDFEWVQVSIMPMFLFSATFYPVEAYPSAVRWLVEVTPLYQAVAGMRALTTGSVTWWLVVHATYLALLGLTGLAITSRRLSRLLLT